MRDSRHLAFCIASTVMIVLASGLLLVTCTAGDMVPENKAHTDAWGASPLQYATEGTFSPVSTLVEWLQPYRELPFKVLATLSDGEGPIIAALKTCWSEAPHRRCQEHVLSNLAEPVLEVDAQLRKRMRDDRSAELATKPVRQDCEC